MIVLWSWTRSESLWIRQVTEQVNINIKYEGYISRQMKQVEQFKKMENKLIPEDIVYEDVHNLRKEAIQEAWRHPGHIPSDRRPGSPGCLHRIFPCSWFILSRCAEATDDG